MKNWCTSPMMIYKVISSVDSSYFIYNRIKIKQKLMLGYVRVSKPTDIWPARLETPLKARNIDFLWVWVKESLLNKAE